MNYLPCVEVEPSTAATASVIWLHGLGADGHDFEALVPELGLPSNMPVRFIFPHSPSIPVTINGGLIMPAWYDVADLSIDRKVDIKQLTASAEAVQKLIDREIERGIKPERIILAGFSQGGAVAYHAALTYNKPLAGLLALSTYFATKDTICINETNKRINIAVMHGSEDSVVSSLLGERAVQALQAAGFTPEYKSYAMEHAVCAEQIADIAAWLEIRLAE
ncbi:alpha/beta hydrolase [Psychromonas ossibalaenae]|uniref:alpha/beta hydrolase n=1 Tax=Psychromonas ossibalaenae TaxID=444922 RepID=UPI0003820BC7|nr:hypothetical protein [Psychromonas ossibalaenae]